MMGSFLDLYIRHVSEAGKARQKPGSHGLLLPCCLDASHQLDFGTFTSTSPQTHFRTTTSIDIAMFLQRSAIAAARRAAIAPITKRTFASSIARRTSSAHPRKTQLTPRLGESKPATPATATVNGVKIKSFHGTFLSPSNYFSSAAC